MADQRLRLLLPDFIPIHLCKELEFIHKSCGTVGYRPNVLSTTLSHLIATNSGHLIIPFIGIREKLKEKVEEFFGCEYELFIEFTGLISWSRGSKIGWHSDDNRPYLKQRRYAAVCYLNSHGEDFKGGSFHFQTGEPATVVPSAGVALIYTADNRNVHCVDEITEGERLTLTLWFSREASHDEDAVILDFLSEKYLNLPTMPDPSIPSSASSNMYQFSPDPSSLNLGCDIRLARIHSLGYDLCSGNGSSSIPSQFSEDPVEVLDKPLRLVRDGILLDWEFSSSLQALQVLQFCRWRGFRLTIWSMKQDIEDDAILFKCKSSDGVEVSMSLAETSLPLPAENEKPLLMEVPDIATIATAFACWKEDALNLQHELLESIPLWLAERTLFSMPS